MPLGRRPIGILAHHAYTYLYVLCCLLQETPTSICEGMGACTWCFDWDREDKNAQSCAHSHNDDHSQLDDHHHHKYIITTAIITITATAGGSNDDAGAQQCHGQDFTQQAMNKIGLGSGRDKIVCERLVIKHNTYN